MQTLIKSDEIDISQFIEIRKAKSVKIIKMTTSKPIFKNKIPKKARLSESVYRIEKIKADRIIDLVCNFYKVSKLNITNEANIHGVLIVKAKHQAMYLIYELTQLGEPNIANIFNRHHSSVNCAKKNVNNSMTYPKYKIEFEELKEKVNKTMKNITVHKLKTWPSYFDDIYKGHKNFEIRKNDRDFKIGDDLLLEEWDPNTQKYTGRHCHREITYILNDNPFIELGENVILSIV